MPLSHTDFAAVIETQRKTHSEELLYEKLWMGTDSKVNDGNSVWAVKEAKSNKTHIT